MSKEIKAIYIHIPFCEHLCDYCDFAKLQYFSFFACRYIDELKKELDSYHILGKIETIYVGGGTPTSLDDDLFYRLLEIIKPYTKSVLEYTFEANPESLSISKLKMMKEFGVNRISLGVETTSDEILASINRHHTFNDAVKAIDNAKSIGFDNINVDLILGLPGSDIKQVEIDINNILTLGVQHVSCYSLTVHPHTVFYNKGINEPLDDECRKYYDLVHGVLLEHGYRHYEISNWCLDGYESRHNLTYWFNNRYYGIGLGASGYIDNRRYTNTKSISEYLKGHYINEVEEVDINSEKEYQIMLNLRTRYGLDLNEFKNRFNIDLLKEKSDELHELITGGYLYIDRNRLIPTYEGMMILDQILLKIF